MMEDQPETSTRRRQQKVAAFIKTNLDKAGFQITLQAIDGAQYYSTIGKKNNPYDLYLAGWGSDWPSGTTIIPPILDGRGIAAEGNNNWSYFNSPEINARIDEISREADLGKAGAMWAALDREVMEKHAPFVPLLYSRNFSLNGSKIGGAFLSAPYGATSLNHVHLKK
jgi:peptide/nickel transport system substrate-binding protein